MKSIFTQAVEAVYRRKVADVVPARPHIKAIVTIVAA
jgi:hypothetical protein